MTRFHQLNHGWNAEPNSPDPHIAVNGSDVILSFVMNHQLFPEFAECSVGSLLFRNCSRYRLGATNDEGWYLGQCRFSAIAPQWGEFYEVLGDLRLDACPNDWVLLSPHTPRSRHFLFYLRDETFECTADDWSFFLRRDV